MNNCSLKQITCRLNYDLFVKHRQFIFEILSRPNFAECCCFSMRLQLKKNKTNYTDNKNKLTKEVSLQNTKIMHSHFVNLREWWKMLQISIFILSLHLKMFEVSFCCGLSM